MIAYHIHIEGQVQGVGYRPYIWRMAREFGLTGWVSNDIDGVHIEVNGNEKQCGRFCHAVIHHAPASARVVRHCMYEIPSKWWKDFTIRESGSEGVANLLITPDLGICEACKQETLLPGNRRHEYAFTTCTDCGPRYSILRRLPYDRIHTTMRAFDPCPDCLREYNDPSNRRYYSQTNSCPACAIKLQMTDSSGKLISASSRKVIQKTLIALDEGKIIAMKGIGGYLLLCDATNSTVIELLRTRKNRPTRPFALLYPSLETVQQDAFVTAAEAEALLSIEAPIVLVKAKPTAGLPLDAIAPHLGNIGVMLPYTPLMVLLMQARKKPLVATSGNESGSPIFYEDHQALHHLNGIADYFISNNREILVPQDDSVVRFTRDDQRIILRRARGLAPTFLPHPLTGENKTWLAMGSDLKSTFSLLCQGNIYVSQYLGDLENYQTQVNFEHTLQHLRGLLGASPQRVLIDKHPVYYSSSLGKRLGSELRVHLLAVQHHEAHFGAVLAENDLLESAEPVLGVIWDGTGWGDDGNIWGGEFFRYESGRFERVTHLDYFDHFLGDKVSREPRLCALALCKEIPEAKELLRPKFSETEWNFYNKILGQHDLLQTSSIGRLFDGVASLLNLCDRSFYEGEAALRLESLASLYVQGEEQLTAAWNFSSPFSLSALIHEVVRHVELGSRKEMIAYNFHMSLVYWIGEVAAKNRVRHLAFSGGVFQNALLVHLIQSTLGDACELYFHQQLSPNDECVSLGQLTWQFIDKHLKTEVSRYKPQLAEVAQ